MPNPRLAAAYSVQRNNQNRGSIPNVSSLVGGKPKVGPEPAGDYQEVDDLHRALGSAMVDKIMGARKMSEGGYSEDVDAEEEGDFLSPNDDDAYADKAEQDLDNQQGDDKSQYDDTTGKGGKTPILEHIMASLRKRNIAKLR